MVWRLPYSVATLLLISIAGFSQTCPTSGTTNLNTNPNTYYPGTGTVNVGATTITVGAIGIGTTPIAAGNLILIIQMQGAEITANNNNRYGNNVPGAPANGYLNNAAHLAGNMEYAVVSSFSGNTISLASGTTRAYRNTDFGTSGQYRFQVVRVPVYYNLTLTANIFTPAWNGSVGGVTVLRAVNNLNMAGFTVNAAGAGFRGGGSRQLFGGAGDNGDVRTLSTENNNGSKGEGTAGTPRYMFINTAVVDNSLEGYVNGSHGRGAPGNAGGGATDGNPADNDENTGGGGGGNGASGGKGGNAWNSNEPSGGDAGASFAQRAANRIVMGGGGGGGTTNNGTGSPGNGNASSGAAGGGIVIVYTRFLLGTGTINVNGLSANNTVTNDGSGGGGAGGSALLSALTGHGNITVTASGGNGGTNSGGGVEHGPGGGGGGGVIYSNAVLNAGSTVNAGRAGTTFGGGSYGAADGIAGVFVQNATLASFPFNTDLCVLLPALMTDFSLQEINSGVKLLWMVSTEVNVKEYVVERSFDGVNFTRIGSVPSRPGTGIKQYSYNDFNTQSAFYRIKTVDIDARYEYSKELLYRSSSNVSTVFSVYPNPGREQFQILIPGSGNKAINIQMTDMTGRVVVSKTDRATGGQYRLSVPVSLKGMYLLQVSSGANSYQQKLMIE
ncbi:MAG: T9SS type A sorting domain-containing protein [Chitinophagaceae bacterium]